MTTYFFSLLAFFTFFPPTTAVMPPQEDPLVNRIIEGVPDDLAQQTLLVARYDMMDLEEVMPPKKRDYLLSVNRSAKIGNSTIDDIFKSKYDHEYKLVGLKQVRAYKEEGYRYFMDLVWMPKQMKAPKREAMVPAYERFESANRMFSNRNSQFQYYFYIRDLETGDVYITSKFQGNADAYNGMKKFLAAVKKDESL